MLLEGSCHCGAVRFSLNSHTPVPYMRCYCSICRKTGGGGGYAINLGGDAATLKVDGEADITVYRVRLAEGEDGLSPARRHFCGLCGSALWVFDPRWPELVHPFASAIDTPLPPAPEHANIHLDSAPAWAVIPEGEGETVFAESVDQSIDDWHKARGLDVD